MRACLLVSAAVGDGGFAKVGRVKAGRDPLAARLCTTRLLEIQGHGMSGFVRTEIA